MWNSKYAVPWSIQMNPDRLCNDPKQPQKVSLNIEAMMISKIAGSVVSVHILGKAHTPN
jgi:hypothetical protein